MYKLTTQHARERKERRRVGRREEREMRGEGRGDRARGEQERGGTRWRSKRRGRVESGEWREKGEKGEERSTYNGTTRLSVALVAAHGWPISVHCMMLQLVTPLLFLSFALSHPLKNSELGGGLAARREARHRRRVTTTKEWEAICMNRFRIGRKIPFSPHLYNLLFMK